MTDKQRAFAEKLKRYSENKDRYNYSELVSRMQHDEKFNDMVIAMTLGRTLGKSSLEKFKFDFSYKPEEE